MKLLSLKADSLFSLGTVEVDLANRGLVLVTGFSEDEGGFNGSGKSSLANKAILWVLFGETAGGVKADAVLNRHGKKKCFGEVQFSTGGGGTYTIRRERPAKLTLIQDGTPPVDVSAATAKDTQELIDGLLGFNFQTFLQTSFFGQGRNLHYPSLPPKDQKAVLEQILPMEEVDRWAEYADAQIKKLQPKIKASEATVNQLSGRALALKGQLESTSQSGVKFEEARLEEIRALTVNIDIGMDFFKKDLGNLAALYEQVKDTDIAKNESTLEVLRAEAQAKFNEMDEAQKLYSKAQESSSAWNTQVLTLSKRQFKLQSESKCSQCQRPYDNEAQIKAELAELEAAITGTKNTLMQADAAVNFYKAQVQTKRGEIEKLTLQQQQLQLANDRRKSYDLNKAQLDGKMLEATGSLKTQLEAAKTKVNPYTSIYENLQAQAAEAEANEAQARSLLTEMNDELAHLQYWKQVYGKDIKLKLFEDACPFLDSRTAYHLQALKNSQIKVEFSTIKRLASGDAKEEFTVNCYSETGGQGFDSLSGGEQQMTSFAIGLALADLASRVGGSESGFMVLDEAFTELDARNGEAVVEYLTSEVQNGKDTILLISNDEALKGLVQTRIHVIKKGGVTHVGT